MADTPIPTKPSVKVYTTTTCTWCLRTKEFLTENEVDYTEVNIETDETARQLLIDKGFTGVPVIEINGTFIQGFNEAALRAKLGLPEMETE